MQFSVSVLSRPGKKILDRDGERGAGLTTLLRHMSWAPQRWESAIVPAQNYEFLQGSIALLLANRLSDVRLSSSQRKRARQLLSKMGPRQAATAGLLADWATDAGAFLKSFEKDLYEDGQIVARMTDTANQSFCATALRVCRDTPATDMYQHTSGKINLFVRRDVVRPGSAPHKERLSGSSARRLASAVSPCR